MRLTPSEPENPTFKDHDFLNRKDTGDQLTRLIQTVHSPLVIAVDGEWGSGKSHFLKCWNNEPKEDITSVYVDAFKQDYLDDPLIALVAALSDAIDTGPNAPSATKKGMEKLRKAAPILGRFALRTAVNYATLGAGNLLDELFKPDTEGSEEAALKGAANDIGDGMTKATDAFWQKEAGRQNAMEQFHSALVELTCPENGKPTQNITIIVDELDRCRPDYALNMLEVIKHFFDIDGINFVLGVNMASLESSVKARYGADIDARRYLQKFVHLNLALRLNYNQEAVTAVDFFNRTVEILEIKEQQYTALLRVYFHHLQQHQSLSLRSIERVTANCIASGLLSRTRNENPKDANNIALLGLHVLKVFYPDLVQKAMLLQLSFEDVNAVFKFKSDVPGASYEQQLLYEVWGLFLLPVSNRVRRDLRERTDLDGNLTPEALARLINSRLHTIALLNEVAPD